MRVLPTLAVLALLLTASPAQAGFTYFTECAERTGANATLVVPADHVPRIGDQQVGEGDELAVFTSDGICAGRAIWSGQSIAIAVWADNTATTEVDGFVEGDSLQFRVYRAGTVYGEDQNDVVVSFLQDYDAGPYKRDAIFVIDQLSFSSEPEPGGPGEDDHYFALGSAYPNPFTTSVTLEYAVPEETRTRLEVFDLLGRRVALLVDDVQLAGRYSVAFQPEVTMPSGMYVVRLQAGSESAVRRMTLLR